MKKIILAVLIAISFNAKAQAKKDSTIELPDSINTISVADVNLVLNFYADKKIITPKEFDIARGMINDILNYTKPKRTKVITVHK